ncbi:MAG: hypothetical protein AB7T31_01390 [Gemmatimonadales bacterium]
MRTNVCVSLVILSFLPAAAAAQADSLPVDPARVHAHILLLTRGAQGTPGGEGLLPLALAEGEIAAIHAELALEAAASLDDVKLHVEHMLHALDPALVFEGPGLGYGFRRATEEALAHIETAAAEPGASDNVRFHAAYVAAALRAALDRADAIVRLAPDIQLAGSAAAAAPLLARLNELSSALVQGRDADRDGLVGSQGGEGGVRQAVWHTTLLERGEGLLARP